MKDKFNRYCAETMHPEGKPEIKRGNLNLVFNPREGEGWTTIIYDYNPYDDLNQSIPVADVLMERKGLHITLIDEEPISKQFRDFVLACRESEK